MIGGRSPSSLKLYFRLIKEIGEERGVGAREKRRWEKYGIRERKGRKVGVLKRWELGEIGGRLHHNAKYFTIKKRLEGRSLKRGWEPGIQGTGGRRFGLPSKNSFLG